MATSARSSVAPAIPIRKGLLQSIPRLDDDRKRLYQIPGSVPLAGTVSGAAPSTSRCPQRIDKCATETSADVPIRRRSIRRRAGSRRRRHSRLLSRAMTDAAAPRRETWSRSFASGSIAFGIGGRRRSARGRRRVASRSWQGETLALVGESGCGKSTLGRLLLRLIEPTAGKRVLRGHGPHGAVVRRRCAPCAGKVQMVFQDPYGSLSPRRTRRRHHRRAAGGLPAVALPQRAARPGRRPAARRSACRRSSMDRYPRQFSGGQRQRIGIARAIAVDPSFIVADEPVSALDVSIQAQIVNLLQDLQEKKGFSYLFIAHDLAVVRHIADRVAVMYLGRDRRDRPQAASLRGPAPPLYAGAALGRAGAGSRRAAQAHHPRRATCRARRTCRPAAASTPAARSRRTSASRERPPLRVVTENHLAACHFAGPNPIPLHADSIR